MSILDLFRSKKKPEEPYPSHMKAHQHTGNTSSVTAGTASSTAIHTTSGITGHSTVTSGISAGMWLTSGSGYGGGGSHCGASSGQYIYTNPQWVIPNTQSFSSVITISGPNSNEIVRLNRDGTVVWANGIHVNEAAAAFGKTLSIGGELAAGITDAVKRRMRDAVFEEIISIAKEKGSLTEEDLTYFWQSAKIVDKLKGISE